MGFSVVMPTYKREHTIHRAIDSLKNQVFKDWELIVVDNYGSNYEFDDERIKLHVYTDERGAAAARNFGIPLATKELICFLDDDDILFEHYMRKFDIVFQNPEVMMARCKMVLRGQEILKLATPQVVMRREYATPTWRSIPRHDQIWYTEIMDKNKWIPGKPMSRLIDEVLCQALHDARGGLRENDSKL